MNRNPITQAGTRCRLLVPLACGILITTATQAQDTYWGLAGEQVYNTQTHALTTIPSTGVGIYLEYQSQGAKAVFDGAGNALFAINNSSINFNGIDQGAYSGYGQVMAIPGKCRKYNVWKLSGAINHRVDLYISQIDASMVTTNGSTSPAPVVTSNTLLGSCSDSYAGAVAAPLNTDGTRYVYFLINNGGMGGYWFQLYRFTIAADGTPNTSPLLVKDSLPADYVPTSTANRIVMDISQDGKTIAYKKCNGKLVTYRLDGSGGAPTQYPDIPLGLEQATTGTGERRWFFSTGSALKFYVEGNTTATTVSTSLGANSELALGRDGNMYTTYGTGELVSFGPGINPAFPFPVFLTGAYVGSTQGGSNYFYFGSHVVRDDINFYSAISFGTPTISINNNSGTGTLDVLDCQPIMLTNTSNTISPSYRINIYEVVSGSPLRDSSGLINDTFNTPVDLRSLIAGYLSNHTGLFDVKVEYRSVCGGQTVTRRINVIAGPVATLGISGSYQTRNNTQPGTPIDEHLFGPFTTAPSATVPANPMTVGRSNTIFEAGSSVSSPGTYFCSMIVHIDKAVSGAWVDDVVPSQNYTSSCSSWSSPSVILSSIEDVNQDPFFTNANAPVGSIWRIRIEFTNACGTLWRALPFKIGAKPTTSAFGYLREAGPGEADAESSVSFAPVPFGNRVSAQLGLSEDAKVSLRIMSVDGRVVAEPLRDELLPAGSRSVEIASDQWPACIYFYDCIINGMHFTGKLVKH